MSSRLLLVLVLAIGMVPSLAAADEIMTFSPTPANMYNLDHYKVYSWGIDVPLDPGEKIIAAELTFDSIRNWDDNPNVLYIHLLNSPALGLTVLNDNQGGGDYFASLPPSEHTPLVTYWNIPAAPDDRTYTFTDADLVVLNAYLADGRVGLGMDPDCHFYNCGIEWTLVTPEPGTLILLGTAIPVLLRRRRTRA
ncbi:MAG: PEP-CTERM sorting domain-containing protein [Planctomycetota bacterium]